MSIDTTIARLREMRPAGGFEAASQRVAYASAAVTALPALLDHIAAQDASIAALTAERDALREALHSIEVYGTDTLSGRVDGPDDREWQRAAVRVMRDRAHAARAALGRNHDE